MTTTKSRLGQTLSAGRLAVTAECLPPLSGDAGAVKKLAALLPDRLDAVVVADNCGHIGGSSLACAAILAAEGRPAVLSMVTRDRNRIALESEALGAAALGIDAIFCLTGDHQSLGVCPQAAGAYDIDSIQLTQAIKKMMSEGRGFNGRAIEPRPEFLVGAAAHPTWPASRGGWMPCGRLGWTRKWRSSPACSRRRMSPPPRRWLPR
jgi:methylenetetrahydrofolate reductase (NADPH)